MLRQEPADVRADPDVRDAIASFLDRVEHRFGDSVERIILYGSVARGEATDASDVDLVVVWDGAFHDGFLGITEVATRIFIDTGILLSPKVLPRETWDEHAAMEDAFYRNVSAEGIVLA